MEKRTVQINKPGDEAGVKSYTFDGAYDEHTQQKVFYEDCCFHLVENVLEGFNGTVFAYGQTGSNACACVHVCACVCMCVHVCACVGTSPNPIPPPSSHFALLTACYPLIRLRQELHDAGSE